MAHVPHDHGPLVIHTRENQPTALQRAQELCHEFQPMHDRMVDSFRRSGWDREDAVHEADARISKVIRDRMDGEGYPPLTVKP